MGCDRCHHANKARDQWRMYRPTGSQACAIRTTSVGMIRPEIQRPHRPTGYVQAISCRGNGEVAPIAAATLGCRPPRAPISTHFSGSVAEPPGLVSTANQCISRYTTGAPWPASQKRRLFKVGGSTTIRIRRRWSIGAPAGLFIPFHVRLDPEVPLVALLTAGASGARAAPSQAYTAADPGDRSLDSPA